MANREGKRRKHERQASKKRRKQKLQKLELAFVCKRHFKKSCSQDLAFLLFYQLFQHLHRSCDHLLLFSGLLSTCIVLFSFDIGRLTSACSNTISLNKWIKIFSHIFLNRRSCRKLSMQHFEAERFLRLN